MEARDGWKPVVVHGGPQAGVTGWVKADFLPPAVLPVDGIGQPVP